MDITPLDHFFLAGDKCDIELGETLFSKTACVLLAGGQGTRLGFEGPKGAFPLKDGISLFSLFADQLKRIKKERGSPLAAAIMTSDDNFSDTIAYFEHHRFFGLERGEISFFVQESLPMLDENKEPLINGRGYPIMAPAGNGGSLHALFSSPIGKEWEQKGIAFLNILPIDNPLALAFDPNLSGLHKWTEADVIIKSFFHIDENEAIGLILEKDGKRVVIEYSEIDPSLKKMRDENGNLIFCLANTGMYSISFNFAKKISRLPLESLPLHLAKKTIPRTNGQVGYKQERFLFDILNFAEKTEVLVYPREISFSPIKTKKDIIKCKLLINPNGM